MIFLFLVHAFTEKLSVSVLWTDLDKHDFLVEHS